MLPQAPIPIRDAEPDSPPFELVTPAAPETDVGDDMVSLPVYDSGKVVDSSGPHSMGGPKQDFDSSLSEWTTENAKNLFAAAYAQTRVNAPDAERKEDAQDIVGDLIIYLSKRWPVPEWFVRMKIRWLARTKYGSAEYREGNQQIPALDCIPVSPEDDHEDAGEENVFSSGAKAGFKWLQQTFENPAEALLGSELRERVRNAIARLPAEQRDVVRLIDLCDVKLPETANLLGLSETTVKGRLQQGRKALQAELQFLRH